MTATTKPFFIVSSGRSGTKMLEKLLGTFDEVEMHHEYCCTHIQPVAARYYMGLISKDDVRDALSGLHQSAVLYSERPLWGDSSNKLSWIIPVLEECFPDARYIHLVRDGRKVVSSFFHKLADEIYDDRSVEVLTRHLEDPERNPAPPPEKRYWWNIPARDPEAMERFKRYDQFQRICFHWHEVNRTILHGLEGVDPERKTTVKLEELTTAPEVLAGLLGFLGIETSDGLFEMLGRPHNVNRPEDHLLTPEQTEKFNSIAGAMMEAFGYNGTEEYEVIY